jgi:hypothetical protein
MENCLIAISNPSMGKNYNRRLSRTEKTVDNIRKHAL